MLVVRSAPIPIITNDDELIPCYNCIKLHILFKYTRPFIVVCFCLFTLFLITVSFVNSSLPNRNKERDQFYYELYWRCQYCHESSSNRFIDVCYLLGGPKRENRGFCWFQGGIFDYFNSHFCITAAKAFHLLYFVPIALSAFLQLRICSHLIPFSTFSRCCVKQQQLDGWSDHSRTDWRHTN